MSLNQFGPMSERMQACSFDVCHPQLIEFLHDKSILVPIELNRDIYFLNSVLKLERHTDSSTELIKTINAADKFKLSNLGLEWMNLNFGKILIFYTDIEDL